jgi:V/A-type H+-transporting ATPase subunit E
MHLKGIENIISRIMGDAETSANELKAQAEAKAAEALAEAKTQAERVYARGLESAKVEVENVLLRGKSMADLEGRKALLSARQEVVDEAFAMAEKALQAKRKDGDYANLLCNLAKSVLKKDSVVVLDKNDFDAVGAAVKSALGCDVEAGDLPSGGLVVKSGGIELNLTFAALLRQYREELEQAVASVLFQ